MHSRTKRNLAAGAAVAVFAGGGALAAMAATGHAPIGGAAHGHRSSHRGAVSGPLGKAAGYLDVSPAQLRRDLKSGRTLGEVADATPGRSEAGLIQVLEAARREQLTASAASLTRRVTAQVRRPYGPGGLARGALFNARAYLGLTPAQLRADRRSGMTLAQIAEQTPGKSQAGLIEALATARREALAAAVAAGTLTAAEEQARAAKLTKRVSALVEHRPSHARQRRSG